MSIKDFGDLIHGIFVDTINLSEKYSLKYTPNFFTDYCPGGMLMPGRSYNTPDYSYGFNGQEKVDEINGKVGSHYTAEFWEYDALLGRRWNTDPVVKPWESPYATFSNNPILFADPPRSA